MTSQEDLNKIHYVHADDTELFEELRQTGVIFNPDATGRIYHISRARGPADLAVMKTVSSEVSLDTPIESTTTESPVKNL